MKLVILVVCFLAMLSVASAHLVSKQEQRQERENNKKLARTLHAVVFAVC
jgi:hypothetical protein